MASSSDSADPRPELRVVAPKAAPAGARDASHELRPDVSPSSTPAAGTQGRGRSGAGVLTWLLIGAALLFAWLWLTQVEKANGLADQIVGLEEDLATARAGLAAWEVHHDAVRGGVEGLAVQLGALQALLERSPTAATGSQAAPSADAAGDTPEGAAPAEPEAALDLE